jgi:hypothetical protein
MYVFKAIPFFNGAILLEFLICWLKGVDTLRLNDSLSSVTAGIFLQLSKYVLVSGAILAGLNNYQIFNLCLDFCSSLSNWW